MRHVDEWPIVASRSSEPGRVVLLDIGRGLLGAVLGCLGGAFWGGVCLFVLGAVLFGGYANLVALASGLVGGAIGGLVGGGVGGATGREGLAGSCGRVAGLVSAPILGWSLWRTGGMDWTPDQWLLVGVVAAAAILTGPVGGLIAFTLGKVEPFGR
jgi:hypothetical protein